MTLENAARFYIQTETDNPAITEREKQIFALGATHAVGLAINALADYDPKSEKIKSCMHNHEWASWLESQKKDILK